MGTPTQLGIINTHSSMEILEIKFQRSADFKSTPTFSPSGTWLWEGIFTEIFHGRRGRCVSRDVHAVGLRERLFPTSRIVLRDSCSNSNKESNLNVRCHPSQLPHEASSSPNKSIEISLLKPVTWGQEPPDETALGDYEDKARPQGLRRKRDSAASGHMGL